MRLKYKVNLLSLGILVVVGTSITGAAVLTIERLTYSFNRKLMSAEVSHLVSRARMADTVLVESGVGHVDSYVRKAQNDLLNVLQEYSYGRTGQLIIVDLADGRRLLPRSDGETVFDKECLGIIRGQGMGVRECLHEGARRFFFYELFPRWNWALILSVDKGEIFAERDAFLRQVTMILVLGVILGFLTFMRFTSIIEDSIQQLSRAALSLGPGGTGASLPVIHTKDEIGELARAFRTMSERLNAAHEHLQAQTDALQETNLRLQREITGHKETGAKLEQLNRLLEQRVWERTAQLKAANDELEAFSYSVSHDLRAPLRSIDGFSKALLDDYGEILGGDGQQFLHRVRRASQRMAQLIDDLLKLSRITRGEMIRKPVNLSLLAREILTGLQQADPARTVSFDLQENVFAEGDGRLLQVVMENLLGNAWKFTAQRRQATIAFGVAGQGTLPDGTIIEGPVFFVRDNGAGFDPAYADKLFGVFQRLHHESEFPGTGVGLATVQRIIQRHSGRIWAEGKPDGGATFYFTL